MAVAFTMTEVNYLMVSLFCDLVRFFSYSYFVVLSSLASLLAFPKFIPHILVRAHRAKLFSNKIFSLNSVLQIERFVVLL